MSLLWLLLLGVDSPCPDDTTLTGLRDVIEQVADSARARDKDTFKGVFRTSQDHVACLTEVIYPVDASRLHAARYLQAALDEDGDLEAQELRAVQAIPGVAAPSWLRAPPTAEVAPPSTWVEVRGPEHVVLFVDGLPMMARPTGRSAIVQAVGAGGDVLWSAWLYPGDPLPAAFSEGPSATEPTPEAGRILLERVTDLLASGDYAQVVELSVPAVSAHPDLARSFLAAADLAQDQLERERALPEFEDPYSRYGRPVRRGAARRGDDRKGLLLGFEVGAPTAVRGEWKIGGNMADGVGLRLGGNAMILGASSAYTGVDSSLYVDWNLTPKWQLETTVGIFFDQSGSAYPNVGAAVQYDPPSPLQINVIGARLGLYGYVVPDVSVSFLW